MSDVSCLAVRDAPETIHMRCRLEGLFGLLTCHVFHHVQARKCPVVVQNSICFPKRKKGLYKHNMCFHNRRDIYIYNISKKSI